MRWTAVSEFLWRDLRWKIVSLLLIISGPLSGDATRAKELLETANRLSEEGRFAEAGKALLVALDESADTDASLTAAILTNLGSVYQDLGDYANAARFAQRALSLWERIRVPGHLDLARPLNTLAGVYCKLARYSESEQLYRRSLAIRVEVLGPVHPDVGRVLNNLAELQLHRRNYPAAEELFRQALAIWEAASPQQEDLIALGFNNLGVLCVAKGLWSQAQHLLSRAISIWERTLGPEHPSLIRASINLATIHSQQGDYALADSLLVRARARTESTLGPQNPQLPEILRMHAGVLRKQNRKREAKLLESRAREIDTIRMRRAAQHTVHVTELQDASR